MVNPTTLSCVSLTSCRIAISCTRVVLGPRLQHGLVPRYHHLLHLCQSGGHVLHKVTMLVEQLHRVNIYLDYAPHYILIL